MQSDSRSVLNTQLKMLCSGLFPITMTAVLDLSMPTIWKNKRVDSNWKDIQQQQQIEGHYFEDIEAVSHSKLLVNWNYDSWLLSHEPVLPLPSRLPSNMPRFQRIWGVISYCGSIVNRNNFFKVNSGLDSYRLRKVTLLLKSKWSFLILNYL